MKLVERTASHARRVGTLPSTYAKAAEHNAKQFQFFFVLPNSLVLAALAIVVAFILSLAAIQAGMWAFNRAVAGKLARLCGSTGD
ncbi:hypothetical protein J2T41_000599 [Pseudomonas citronellolis]|uniref:hypothetical protein n=1 Tax=Pseudomonas citronellolis TaxID=53408 RepID=UPI00209F8CCF|nr:hypothetical protein [Pseudomonas citronellolis]MCP1641005.1 hypothetical protein [Pseudomonas citronellolis]MCP1663923.1 hypothetical protein [Pseudomonas citronellolis]MCP1697101.1 hypothetical protein [Pseudomonas citronellolis]MCP1701265.1 hypothetical protein [Pseudomonas citronellolis]MCP1795710.1 hypothetical protein [Pseudomonas citronellolis]